MRMAIQFRSRLLVIISAKVRLLSPQVLIQQLGGHANINNKGIQLRLANNVTLFGKYCDRSNLPPIPMAHTKSHQLSFWNEAFGLNVTNLLKLKNILGEDNANLSAAQKEVLLWHQRLSHVSIRWVQMLMQKRDWLKSDGHVSLHNGPFISTKGRAPTCDKSGLKCGSVPANIEYLYIRIYLLGYSVYSKMDFFRYPPFSKLRFFFSHFVHPIFDIRVTSYP